MCVRTLCTNKGEDVCLTSPTPCVSAEGLSDHRCVSDVAQPRSLSRLALSRPTTMTLAILLLIAITKQMAITNVHNILNT